MEVSIIETITPYLEKIIPTHFLDELKNKTNEKEFLEIVVYELSFMCNNSKIDTIINVFDMIFEYDYLLKSISIHIHDFEYTKKTFIKIKDKIV